VNCSIDGSLAKILLGQPYFQGWRYGDELVYFSVRFRSNRLERCERFLLCGASFLICRSWAALSGPSSIGYCGALLAAGSSDRVVEGIVMMSSPYQ
jgi:hypothetical protein